MWRVPDERLESPDLSVPWTLPTGPAGVTAARQAARQTLEGWGVNSAEALETLELLVSELASNVVKHAAGRASLRLVRDGDVVRIEVADTDPTHVPVEQDVDVSAQSGRGLLLVSSLATSWGYDRDNQQKCTWAELDLSAFVPTLSG